MCGVHHIHDFFTKLGFLDWRGWICWRFVIIIIFKVRISSTPVLLLLSQILHIWLLVKLVQNSLFIIIYSIIMFLYSLERYFNILQHSFLVFSKILLVSIIFYNLCDLPVISIYRYLTLKNHNRLEIYPKVTSYTILESLFWTLHLCWFSSDIFCYLWVLNI